MKALDMAIKELEHSLHVKKHSLNRTDWMEEIRLKDIKELKEAIAELEALNQPKSCEWHLGDYDQNSWISKCGAEWILIEDTPLGNGMNFCQKCGRKLIKIEPKEQ